MNPNLREVKKMAIIAGKVQNVNVLGIVGRLVKFVDESDQQIDETLADYIKAASLDVVEIYTYPKEQAATISFKKPVGCEVKVGPMGKRVVTCGYQSVPEKK